MRAPWCDIDWRDLNRDVNMSQVYSRSDSAVTIMTEVLCSGITTYHININICRTTRTPLQTLQQIVVQRRFWGPPGDDHGGLQNQWVNIIRNDDYNTY